uniref:RNase III domain-containing protein n=1 Tax=viral metagenome TaxID=1070528 RepID=A0A6C0IVC0_9ZZZZ
MNEEKNIKLSPWNEYNRLLTKEDVYTIYEKCGFENVREIIKINDLNLYQKAFVHSSYTKRILLENDINEQKPENCIDLQDEDYEDMEFLGDRCLDLSIAFYLFRKYPDTDQGFKTKMKTKIVKKETLANFAEFLGFPNLLIISKHIEEKTMIGRNNKRILEDVMEAFICAIFLDQNKTDTYYSKKMKDLEKFRLSGPGWQIVNGFIENLIENCIDFEELVLNEENYKEVLLQYYQKEFKITPKYLELNIDGPPHKRIFTMGVLDKDGNILARGTGKSKKEAEQLASLNALKFFDEIEDDNIN